MPCSWQMEPEPEIDPRFWEACGDVIPSQLELDIRAANKQAEIDKQVEWDRQGVRNGHLVEIFEILCICTLPYDDEPMADVLAKLENLAQQEGDRPADLRGIKHSDFRYIARQLWNGEIGASEAVVHAKAARNK